MTQTRNSLGLFLEPHPFNHELSRPLMADINVFLLPIRLYVNHSCVNNKRKWEVRYLPYIETDTSFHALSTFIREMKT